MNDDWGARLFFKLSARYGNTIYNFKGLSFHKSKYRGVERPLYFASNSLCPCGDIYLAFAAAAWQIAAGQLSASSSGGSLRPAGKQEPIECRQA